jgi:hypothetical protein
LLRFVEYVNRLRYFIFGVYYGDQGIFVQTEAYRQVGSFPGLGIIESSKLSQMLRQVGRMVLIDKLIITSPRRIVDGGVLKVLIDDFKIWFYDFIGLNVQKFSADYLK